MTRERDTVRRGPFKSMVEVPVKETERKERERSLAKLCIQQEGVEAEKREAMSDFNQRLRDVKAEIRAVSRTVENGTEVVEKDVYEILNYDDKSVQMYLAETDKPIGEPRPMTAKELQSDLTDTPVDSSKGNGAAVKNEEELPDNVRRFPPGSKASKKSTKKGSKKAPRRPRA